MTSQATHKRNCRFCSAPITQSVVDLGLSPVSNAFPKASDLSKGEKFYPLHAFVCSSCFLVQIDDVESPEHHFNDDYAYFSSYSSSWVKHAEMYVEKMMSEYGIGSKHRVIEVASNDGYLLQHFVKRGVEVLGIEPSANVAQAAEKKGVRSLVRFFGVETARTLKADGVMADLLLGNNVVAHVPNINDFIAGMKVVLNPQGIVTLEFPHLLRMLNEVQFDTIYHEHFSYLSFAVIKRIFEKHGLKVFNVEEIPTHGGSLRVFAAHKEDSSKQVQPAVASLLQKESDAKLEDLSTYQAFNQKVLNVKMGLLDFLIREKKAGKKVVGYGAPAKGNTLLNYCGVRTEFIDYTVDLSTQKQGRFLPGVRIPVFSPEKIKETKPDFVLILPWNLKDEIMNQMSMIRSWGGKFVVPIPELRVLE